MTSCFSTERWRAPLLAAFLLVISLFQAFSAQAQQTLTFGLHMNRPLNFMDADGEVKGLVIDVFRHIAKKEGWQVSFEPCKWSECLSRLESGEIDVLSAIGYTAKREKLYDFTQTPLITNWGLVVTQPKTEILSIIDLEDKTIAVMKRAGHTTALKALLEKFSVNAQYLEVDDFKDVLSSVHGKRADAGVVNRLFASQFAHDYQVLESSIIYNPIEIRYAFTKGKHTEILKIVDGYLQEMRKDKNSIYFQSLHRWFGQGDDGNIPVWIKQLIALAIAVILGLLFTTWLLKSKVKKTIRESDALFRAIVETGPVSLIISDTKTEKILFANNNSRSMFGIDSDAQQQRIKTTDLLTNTEDRSKIQNILKEKGSLRDYQIKLKRSDDEEFWASLNMAPMRFKGINTIATSIIDISERKQAEEEFQQQKYLFEGIFRDIPDAMLLADTDRRIVMCNPGVKRIFGYEEEELKGQLTSAIYESKDEYEKQGRIRFNLTAQKQLQPYEVNYRRKSGEIFPAETIGASIKNSDGEVLAYIGLMREITERKAVEAELAKHRDNLQEMVNERTNELAASKELAEKANKAKSSFLASMSHELRTPLNAIIGFSNAIKEQAFGPLNDKRYNEYLGDIQSSGEHLLKLINDILDVSAIEAGKIELNEQKVSISDVINSSTNLVLSRAISSQLSLDKNVPKDLPFLWADERRLTQILLNLLSNAVKFTPPGGTITTASYVDTGGEFILSVTDTGVGMSNDEIEKAMAQFGQVDSHLNRKHEGTGLGLPLTKGLVELHHGQFKIKSEKGKGTSVTITFPTNRVMGDDDQIN